jgi:uncharacterized protein YidB (DUF937 family)
MATNDGWETIVPSSQAAPVAKEDTGGWETITPATTKPTSPDRGVHNILRTSAETIPSAAAGLAAFGAGMAAAAPVAAVVAPLTGPFAPLTAAAIEFGGGLGTAFVASGAAQKVTNWMHEAFAPEDYKARQIEKAQYPYGTFAAQTLTGLAGMSPKTVPEVAGKLLTKPAVQRAVSGTLMGGIEAGSEYATEGKVDPLKVAASAVGGAAMPGFNVAGKKLFEAGGGAVKAVLPNKIIPVVAPDTLPPKPTATSTPEEKATFVKRMDEIKVQRDSVAPLEQAAIRNTETGNIELMGPKHDLARKDAIKGDATYEEGFVDSRGNFHERQAAVDQAKRSGQIPKDHVLESPEGERPGLHSGDLRKVNDPRFAVTEDQPAGVPKTPSDEPKTRAEHFKDVTDLEHKLYVEEGKVEADSHLFTPEELATKNKELDGIRSQIEDMRKNAPQAVVADKRNPTNIELHEILAGSKTLGEGLRAFADGGYGGKGQRWLAKKLASIDRVNKSTLTLDYNNALRPPEGSIPKEEWAGAHYSDSNTTHLYEEATPPTLLHESVHAASLDLLRAGTSAAAKQINALYEHVKSVTPKEVWDSHYGSKNAEEFLSEAFANSRFISFLKQTPGLKGVEGGSSWAGFKRIIKNTFGASKPEEINALDQVLEHGARLMESGRTTKTDVTSSRVAPSVKETVDSDGVITKETSVDRTKTSPRDVKSLEEFEQIAADIYEKHGEVDAVKFFEGYQEYKKTWLEPVAETEKFVGTNLRNKAANQRIIHNETADMKAAVPDPVRRQAIAEAVDRGDLSGLSAEEAAVATKYSNLARDIGERAVEKGVVKGLLEDYVTHIVDWAGAPKGAREEFINAIFGKGSGDSTKGMSVESKFGKQRLFKTFADLEFFLDEANARIAAAGKTDFRLQIKTKDIAEIYKEYATSMEKAIENKALVDNLKQVRNVAGESLVREITKENPMPPGWEVIDTPQFSGYAIHPDMIPALKFVFDAGPGDLMKALGMISQVSKRLNVIGSFFHAKSLMEVISSSKIPVWSVAKEALIGPAIDKLLGTKISGVTRAVDQFRKGGVGDNVDKWIKEGGLQLEVPEDVSQGVLSATGKFADSMISKYGPKTRVLEKSLSAVEKYTLGYIDKFTWDFLHTGGKIMVADGYLDKARIDAAKQGKPFDEVAARKEISGFVNNSFGGLNWFDAATQTQNHFAKQMAMAAYNPAGRRGLQIALFAPDWTLSTLRAFTDALPKELSPTKWHPVEGIKGMMTPTTKADYARLYQFKTALTYLTLINAINMMTANRPVWDNKDPTRIEWPDGTSMQAMKHAMEPYHWIMDPDKTLSNKLGFIPKAAIVGMAGVEYASPQAQKLVDPSATGRLAAVAKMGLPFQVAAAGSAPPGEGVKRAVLGTLGFPVYGATPEQRKAARAEREKLLKKAAKDYHVKAKEKGWEKP